MSRWFRLDDDIINDPKILLLPEAMRWIWIAFLCIASKNSGALPTIEIIALSLRVKPSKASEYLNRLVDAGLIDRTETGLAPHNWNGRQFKSDVSTERVKRFRKQERNVSETPPETDTQQKQKEKKDAAPSGAQIVSVQTPEKTYFDQADQYLGKGGRSIAGSLLKSKDGNIPAAHAALLTAVQKSNPREYLGAIIRNRDGPDGVADRRSF